MVEQATDPLNWINRTERKHLIDKYTDPERVREESAQNGSNAHKWW